MKKVAILQSCYIPWKGYFDIINMVDEFIFYDDVLYSKNDWRNRNIVKTVSGSQWLTIPVQGSCSKLIKEIEVVGGRWTKKHWKALVTNYSKSPFFSFYKDKISKLYADCEGLTFLSEINYKFISEICKLLEISTTLCWSMDYTERFSKPLEKTERLIETCKLAGASEYISGPSAKNYIDEQLFKEAGIKLSYVSYDGYPEYPQLFNEFIHEVTMLDLIFNAGPDFSSYMKTF